MACQRHCCLCHERKHTRLTCHHIVQEADEGPSTLENCIPLCPDCHAEVKAYDPRHHPGTTSYSETELHRRRDDWYEIVRRRSEALATRVNMQQATYPYSSALHDQVEFDYSNHDGFLLIGEGNAEFLTRWTQSGNNSIHASSNNTNIRIASPPHGITLADIEDASAFDFSSAVRTIRVMAFSFAKITKGCSL